MTKKIYGVTNVRRASMAPENTQRVTVSEHDDGVKLDMLGVTYPALLTPDEARHLASVLTAAADSYQAQRKETSL